MMRLLPRVHITFGLSSPIGCAMSRPVQPCWLCTPPWSAVLLPLCAQVQADLAQMQLTHSRERAHAAAQQQQVSLQQQQMQRALADAQAAKADAERRLRDSERHLSDMRAALESQERLLVVLREQVAEGGAAATRVGELEMSVQVRRKELDRGTALRTVTCRCHCWRVRCTGVSLRFSEDRR